MDWTVSPKRKTVGVSCVHSISGGSREACNGWTAGEISLMLDEAKRFWPSCSASYGDERYLHVAVAVGVDFQ